MRTLAGVFGGALCVKMSSFCSVSFEGTWTGRAKVACACVVLRKRDQAFKGKGQKREQRSVRCSLRRATHLASMSFCGLLSLFARSMILSYTTSVVCGSLRYRMICNHARERCAQSLRLDSRAQAIERHRDTRIKRCDALRTSTTS